jgi:serine-type D-Ala-D-Ala carboxypeptidase
VTQHGQLLALRALGRFTYEADAPEVTPDTIFDLASVSKVVATTTMAALLYERGLLDLEMPLTTVVREFSQGGQAPDDPRRHLVTLRMLLAHASGLPAYEKIFLRAESRDALLTAAASVPLAYDPGTNAEYSDIGFILLGLALERLADDALDQFAQHEIFGPLGLARTTFTPPHAWHNQIAPTANDRYFRHRVIQGEVQDENASVMGGVAGHAGVFSTAQDVALFANSMMMGSPDARPLLRNETLALFTTRQSCPESSRALGWDTPSQPSQSGRHLSPESYGHLGYTGTSLWIDPVRQLSITLLTNRTWPDCTNQAIKEIRPRVHDAIVEVLW